MVARKHFRRFHNYLLGCASEFVAPAARRLARRLAPAPPSPPASWRRGLILSHTRIGDLLFRTCSLEQLSKGLPRCEWHYLVAPDSAEILRDNPALTSVLPFCDHSGFLRLLPGAAAKLRDLRFDVALCTDPETYWQDHKVALAARIPNRVGFTHRGLSGLVTHPVNCRQPSPWADYFRQIVAQLTGSAPDWPLVPRIFPSPEDERCALLQWRELKAPKGVPVVACFMTTREQAKVWPLDYYLESIQQIHQRSGARIALLGSRQDSPVLEQCAVRSGIPCRVIAGELSLRGLFCFLRKCSAVLAPDSGPRHIANAAGTPVVFLRNLFCSKIETGSYCPNETDLSPDAEFVPVRDQEALLRTVRPTKVIETILHLLRQNGAPSEEQVVARSS